MEVTEVKSEIKLLEDYIRKAIEDFEKISGTKVTGIYVHRSPVSLEGEDIFEIKLLVSL